MSTGNWWYDSLMARRQAQEMAAALEKAKHPRRDGVRWLILIVAVVVWTAYHYAK